MFSHKQDSAGSGSGRSIFVRYVAQRLGLLAASLFTGFIVGIAYRSLIDDPSERDLANYVRSGMHGVGIALAGGTVQAGFASTARCAASLDFS